MGETAGGTLKRGSDRIVAGVCSGLAQFFHLDPTLVRVVFVVLALVPPAVGIILYLVLWFLMEPAAGGATGAPTATAGQQFGGVIGDLRREFRGALSHPGRRHLSGLWGGIILIAAGAFLLLANLGYLNGFRWDLLWPVLLIAVGLLVLVRRV
ncbi:MAG TPA: PspC domain-containing protein [Candidatus Dormibacteraeota bacterium]|nr:PspC domain-containing protein [Candidatus Dormibacteraeota bacterium]